MSSVAILYICTGRYTEFWPNFFRSAEQYLLPGYDKHYFVFTDTASLEGEESGRVHRVEQEALPWPYPTLYRFRFFERIRSQLATFDYIYFFNANCRLVQPITADMLLPKEDEELVVTNHPYYWNQPAKKFTYERNPASAAYIPKGEGTLYAAGGLNGGTAARYLSFIATCNEYLRQDEAKGIIAVWHDESYLNRYILGRKVKILHPGFLYPAETILPFDKIIHLEDKATFLQGYGKYAEKPLPWYRKIFRGTRNSS